MIKKLTITSLTALSLLLVTAQAEGMKCQGGKCGAGMAKQDKAMTPEKEAKTDSPFLVKQGLPHMTKMIMKSWDDVKLALTADQKTKLLEVRKETMGAVKKLKPEIEILRREIVQANSAGTKASELKSKVDKLAALESEATMVHLNCLDKSKAILSAEQYRYLT